MGAVDETWAKKELQAECKRRGMTGYSRLNKASLLRALQTGGCHCSYNFTSRCLGYVTFDSPPAMLLAVDLLDCRIHSIPCREAAADLRVIGGPAFFFFSAFFFLRILVLCI